MVGLTARFQADQVLFFRIEVGANLGHFGERRHHLELAAGSIPLQGLKARGHHFCGAERLPQPSDADLAATDGGLLGGQAAVVVLALAD